MIGFTTVGTNDIQRAMAFYDALFEDLSVTKLIELPGLAGWDWNHPIFGVMACPPDKPAVPARGALIGLGQRTRARVIALHERAITMGATNAGDPSVRGMDGSQAFFAGYVCDLDGNKLCFYCVGPGE